jgi:hypothetical protein
MNVTLEGEKGDLLAVTPPAAPDAPALPPRVRDGETRRDTWERIRRAARAAGMSRRDAYDYATRETDRLYANGMAEAPVPFDQVEPDPPPVQVDHQPATPETPTAASTGGVQGLGDLPVGWPVLPSNASLQAEVGWVQGNRVLVVEGMRVDLGRALSPAPSYATLAWLETSILYPSKFSDVCVKVSTGQQDDQEDVRREKLALAEVRTLLAEASASTLLADS